VQSCGSNSVSCIDCSKTFSGEDMHSHTSCISEAEKYQGALFRGKKTTNNQQPKNNGNQKNQQNQNSNQQPKIQPANQVKPEQKEETKKTNGIHTNKQDEESKSKKRKNQNEDVEDGKKLKVEEKSEEQVPQEEVEDAVVALFLQKMKWKKITKRILKKESNKQLSKEEFQTKISSLFFEKIQSDINALVNKKIGESSFLIVEGEQVRLA